MADPSSIIHHPSSTWKQKHKNFIVKAEETKFGCRTRRRRRHRHRHQLVFVVRRSSRLVLDAWCLSSVLSCSFIYGVHQRQSVENEFCGCRKLSKVDGHFFISAYFCCLSHAPWNRTAILDRRPVARKVCEITP
jgi:hypothetical protein